MRCAHGDGGFTDNLGLMPLLARRVKNVIAFVNSNKRLHRITINCSRTFFSLASQSGSGDKTMNAVFPQAKYRELLDGLDQATPRTAVPPSFCQTLPVSKNEIYNIAVYDGLKVCWVYNHAGRRTGARVCRTRSSRGWRLPSREGAKTSSTFRTSRRLERTDRT